MSYIVKVVYQISLRHKDVIELSANTVRICFIKCDVVHFSLDVWVYECAVRQAEGSGALLWFCVCCFCFY